jgi:hypothetical protein
MNKNVHRSNFRLKITQNHASKKTRVGYAEKKNKCIIKLDT